MKFYKKSAFTLTEVMLTIALLGFLASMTLSTVGASVQQRARLAEFRTAYAKMDAALRNVVIDEGKVYSCYSPPTNDEKDEYGLRVAGGANCNANTECDDFMLAFVKAMGSVKSCENNSVNEGCLPRNYPSINNCFTNIENSNAYVLDNGMIIFDDNGSGMQKFAIDVNGRKGPNKWGQDIFPFATKVTEAKVIRGRTFIQTVGILPPDQACMNSAALGSSSKTTHRMMKESAGVRD